MATRQELLEALRNADRAAEGGNAEAAADARRLAQLLSRMGDENETPERSTLQKAGRLVGSAAEGASRGILEMVQLPGAALNQLPRLANMIPGVDNVGPIVEDFDPAIELGRRAGVIGVTEPETGLERAMLEGGRAATQGMTGAGLLGMGMRGAAGTSKLGHLGREIVDTAASRPGLFLAGEFGGGAGSVAGAAGGREAAELTGLPQNVGETLGALTGGITGAAVPVAGVAGARRGAQRLQQDVLPFTEGGGKIRAARQLQRKVAPPDDPNQGVLLREAASRAREAAPGVSPARATREPGLMAQEGRIAQESPTVARNLESGRTMAQRRVQQEVADMFGDPQDYKAWANGLVSRVSAPGAKVDADDLDDMMTQGFESFRGAYQGFDQHQINPQGLGETVDRALKDPDLFVGEDARNSIRGWVDGQLRALGRRAADRGALTSGDLIELRQNLRGRSRDMLRTQTERSSEAREVLGNVERTISRYIEDALPDEAAKRLRDIDGQYRQFKVVEDAVYRDGGASLSPQKVLDSIRRGSRSRGQFTRGDQDDLRRIVAEGLPGDQLLKDPAQIRRITRGLEPDELRPLQAKLMRTLADSASGVDGEGVRVLSGAKLRDGITQNRQALRNAGLTDGDFKRLNGLTDQLLDVQRQSPEALARMFEDGPNSIVELVAAIAGAKSGQNLAGGGIGASLVIASYMSNRARKILANLTSDKAQELLLEASTNPDLYASLLMKETASAPRQREAARILQAWLANEFGEQVLQDDEEPERGIRPGPQE